MESADMEFFGRKSMGQVAAEFPAQLNAIKSVLLRWLSADAYGKGLTSTLPNGTPASGLLALLLANYMTGDPYNRDDQRFDTQEHEFAQQMQSRIPGMVDGLMKPDRELRELIVTALRIRFALSCAEWGS